MKKLLYIISFFVLANQETFANKALIIEPLYGFEKYYRLTPAPAKFRTRTLLGARATYGVPYLSAELEVTSGEDSDSSLNGSISKTVNKREQAKLGITSNFVMASFLHFFTRLGARGSRDTISLTDAGTTTTTEGAVKIDPYLGAGLRFVIGQNFSLNAGVTATQVKDENGNADYDLQTSFSASVGIGKF